jgi:hypothetical protein
MFLACAGLASANSIGDPGIIVKGGTGSTQVGLVFPAFNVPSSGGGTFIFLNISGVVMKTLTFTFMPGGPTGSTQFMCGNAAPNPQFPIPFFSSCNFLQTGSGPGSKAVVTFFGGAGIPIRGDFAVQIFGWTPGGSIQGVANVPEPATMSLMLLGLGAAGLRRKFVRT